MLPIMGIIGRKRGKYGAFGRQAARSWGGDSHVLLPVYQAGTGRPPFFFRADGTVARFFIPNHRY